MSCWWRWIAWASSGPWCHTRLRSTMIRPRATGSSCRSWQAGTGWSRAGRCCRRLVGEMGSAIELAQELVRADVRAVRLYPRTHSYSLDTWQCGDLLSALSERRYLVLMDIEQTDWSEVDRICAAFPDLSLVITQLGYRYLRFLFGLWPRHQNLYCDLSNFSTYLGVEEVLERFGSDRLLFGTGLPTLDGGGPIARVFYTRAPESDIEAMAHGNLERLLDRVRTGKEGAR